MRGRIVVLDLDGLARHHAEHMRMILAALLVEHDRVFGDVKSAAAKAVLHVDEHVGEITAVDDDVLGFIRAFAARILAHVDLG